MLNAAKKTMPQLSRQVADGAEPLGRQQHPAVGAAVQHEVAQVQLDPQTAKPCACHPLNLSGQI